MQILDYSRGYPRARSIRDAGYSGVIRYLPREGTTRVLPVTAAELADMRSEGLAVALVHQHADRARALLGRDAGRHDGAWAMARANELPNVNVRRIYFAVDFDTNPAQWPVIAEYFRGLADAIGAELVAAYGEYDLLEFLSAQGVIRHGWQPYAWSPGHNQDGQPRHPCAALFQRLQQITVDGVLADVNDVLTPDFGQLEFTNPGGPMPWRVAVSLDVLLNQLNTRAPGRSKVSDGSIGDAAHASRASDHNPNAAGVVTARDYTHDPAGGLDCHWLADTLVRSGDPRIKYLIWNRRIYTPGIGWKPYTGPNPHTKHLHLSVHPGALGDQAQPWGLDATPHPTPAPPAGGRPTLQRGSNGPDVALVQRYLAIAPADGVYGPVTEAAVRRYQSRQGLTADGIVGPATWARIQSGLGAAVPGGGGTHPPAPARTSRPTIQRGSTGEHVRVLQRWLGLTADGVFGPATEAKVKRYQAMKGLTADGIVGPKTWSAMGL